MNTPPAAFSESKFVKPVLLSFENKKQIENFIDNKIVIDPLCSERLVNIYTSFVEYSYLQKKSTKISKRLFQYGLLHLLKEKSTTQKNFSSNFITKYSTPSGVIITGIGLLI